MPLTKAGDNINFQGKYYFKETYLNEYDAFAKYYNAISKNGCINKILRDIEVMNDYCELFKDVMNNEIPNEELNSYFEPIPLKKQSKDILYCSNLLGLENSIERGKHFIAKEEIPRDTVIINECPTVLQVRPLCTCVGDKDSSLYRCHNCGITCKLFYTCRGCNVCIFCSRTCLSMAYKNYHRYECYGLQRHFWSMEDTDYSYMAFRLMLYGASKHFVTDIKDEMKYGNPENNYPFIYSLETNFNQLSSAQINKILYGATRNLLYLILKTTFFDQFQSKSDMDKIHLYIGGLMVKHFCHAQMNNVIIKYPNFAKSWGLDVVSGTGKAICPTIACINHACSPNCVIVVCSNYLLVKSLKTIERGEEITVCYAEVNALLTVAERHLITQEILLFTCYCSFCEYERKLNNAPYKCLLCFGGNARKIEDDQGKITAHCLDCDEHYSMDIILKHLKTATVCRSLYDVTYSIDHLTRLAECYSNIFPYKSLQMLDVYKLLYDKHNVWGEKPLEVLKYGLLLANIIENCVPRLYIPLLLSKVKFMFSFVEMKKFKQIKRVTPEEYEIIKIFVNEVVKVKRDLLFYLPFHRIVSYDHLLKEVHHLFQKCTPAEKKEKRTKKKVNRV
ncbi:unnamed protein product [Phaedon cochleariae]|uniref:SET domain-containing protein n=1 Tax=Phaedon cochleariae TaxID=80249 RepID=A0A9P0GPT2_PHACE|nr:unnamed protein product [Phaedon cochleariae]